jgi:hypothetical protein
VLFIFIILLFEKLNNKSIIDAIYVIVSYTYGPLLGMYSFGLFTKLKPMGPKKCSLIFSVFNKKLTPKQNIIVIKIYYI